MDRARNRYMNFAQIAGALGDFNLHWPDRVGGFLTVLGVLDFDVDAIGPNCVFSGWSWHHDLYLQLLLPAIVLIFNKGEYLIAKGLFLLTPRFRFLTALSLAPANEAELESLKHRLNMKILSFINMIYMTLVRYCCAAFICSEVAPDLFALDSSPPNQCYTPEHFVVMGIATVGLVVYVAGFPLYVIRKLVRISQDQRHSDPRTLAKFGEFYQKYEPHAFKYELMQITRRGVFGVVGVFGKSPEMQCLFCQVVLFAQFVAQVRSLRGFLVGKSGAGTRLPAAGEIASVCEGES